MRSLTPWCFPYDFQVILGVEFLQEVKAVPMPFLNALFMMDGDSPYMVALLKRALEGHIFSYASDEGTETGRPDSSHNDITRLRRPQRGVRVRRDGLTWSKLSKLFPRRYKVEWLFELNVGVENPVNHLHRASFLEWENLQDLSNKLLDDRLTCGYLGAFEEPDQVSDYQYLANDQRIIVGRDPTIV